MNKSTSDIRREIESTREAMGETIGALAEKANVKARMGDAVAERKTRLRNTLRAKRGSIAAVIAGLAGIAALTLLVRRRQEKR